MKTEETSARSMMEAAEVPTYRNPQWMRLAFVGVLHGAILGVGLGTFLNAWNSPESRLYYTAAGYPAVMRRLGRPIPVPVAVVEREDLTVRLSASGRMEYRNLVEVRSESPGVISAIHVTTGQVVRKGDPLLTIDRGGVEARIASLDLEMAKERLRHAEADYRREKAAFESGITPRATFSGFEEAYREAQIAVSRAEENYKGASTSRSSLVLRQSNAAEATDGGDIIQLHALTDGVVERITSHEGESIAGSNAVLMYLGRNLLFRAPFDQQEFADIAVGQTGDVYLRALPNLPLPARVVEKETIVTPMPRIDKEDPPYAFGVWVEVQVPKDVTILPGMNGFCLLANEKSGVVVPSASLSRYSGREGTVIVVDEADRARARVVQYGATGGGWVEIVHGLNPGDRIVARGSLAIEEGDSLTERVGE
jgi:RND family efflux transporter MFP subunit